MNTCKLCGCKIPEENNIPMGLLIDTRWAGHRINTLDDFPDIFKSICNVHLDNFARWYYKGRFGKDRFKPFPQTKDVVRWVEREISILSSRMMKGFPGGYCQCMVGNGHRNCTYMASGYIGNIMACKRHLDEHAKGKKIFLEERDSQPITKAAMSLLNIEGG